MARAPALAARPARRRRRGGEGRAARFAALPVLRKDELLERQNAADGTDVRRLRRRRLGREPAGSAARAARLRVARADPRARDRTPRLLAHGSGLVRRRLSRRRPRPQQLQLSPHARRLDDGKRRARDRLHRPAGRNRADGAAVAGHGRAGADGVHGNAELSSPPAREGRTRDRRRIAAADQGDAQRRGRAARAARVASRRAASPPTSATAPPTSGSSRTRRSREKGSSSTRASSSRSSARERATRSPTARWARSS